MNSENPNPIRSSTAQPWLISLLEEHLESLQMLWELRLDACRDADYFQDDLRELDERIESHIDGLFLAIDYSLPMLAAALGGSSRCEVFSAAIVLLGLSADIWKPLFTAAIVQAEGEALDGFIDGFANAPLPVVEEHLRELLGQESPAVASVAVAALAFHGRLKTDNSVFSKTVADPDPLTRARAWLAVSYCGAD